MIVFLPPYLSHQPYKVREHVSSIIPASLHSAQWELIPAPQSAEGMNELLKSYVANLFRVLSQLMVLWESPLSFLSFKWSMLLDLNIQLTRLVSIHEFFFKTNWNFCSLRVPGPLWVSMSEGCSLEKWLQELPLEHLVLYLSLSSGDLLTISQPQFPQL